MNKFDNTLYAREPLTYKNGIPVFSRLDEYIQNYEKIAKDHLASVTDTVDNPFIEKEIWVALERSTAKLIKHYSKPNDKILDVGVGTGRLLQSFEQLRRYGLDISLEYLQEASKKGIDVCFSRIEDVPYHPDYFDLVVCTDVLEHVLDLNRAVSQILKVLKTDGILIVRVPYKEDLKVYLDFTEYKYVHLRNFDEYSIRLLFEKVFGCDFIDISPGCLMPLGTYFKYKVPFFRISSLFKLLVRSTYIFSERLGNKLTNAFYHPIDINMVFKKTNKFATSLMAGDRT